MRTLIPPQFTDEDRQRLLTLALTAPTAPDTGPEHPQPPDHASVPVVTPVVTAPAAADAWDESW